MRPLKIGILRTDAVRPELQARHGDYPAMFRALLHRAAGAGEQECPLRFRDLDVRRDDCPERFDDCDAWLITGSKHSVNDDADWIRRLEAFVRELDEHRQPLVGICFGQQLVARALGGEVAEQDWVLGVQRSRVLRSLPWMDPPLSAFSLISSHRDQVRSLPPGAQRIAASDACPVGGFVVGDHILCLQGHPEFRPEYAAALLESRRGQIDADRWRAAMASLAEPIDPDPVGRWILTFMQREWPA
jgi:GMP synthase (glutamine-hydrolysing)